MNISQGNLHHQWIGACRKYMNRKQFSTQTPSPRKDYHAQYANITDPRKNRSDRKSSRHKQLQRIYQPARCFCVDMWIKRHRKRQYAMHQRQHHFYNTASHIKRKLFIQSFATIELIERYKITIISNIHLGKSNARTKELTNFSI